MLLALATAFAVPAAGVAAPGGSSLAGGAGQGIPGPVRMGVNGAVISTGLVADALAHPNTSFKVIVQVKDGFKSSDAALAVKSEQGKWRRAFSSIDGGAATLTGKRLIHLARSGRIEAITLDKPVGTMGYENAEMWRQSTDVAGLGGLLRPVAGLISGAAPSGPAIAVVDSGVDATKAGDFGSRIVASVSFCSLCKDPKSTVDEEGHGTMVAGVLAGANSRYPGVAKNNPIVAVKTANADGQSLTSDVITAADWILANKDKYGIKVANFSMAGATPTSFRFDPLDQAVERLWFHGITVVAAAGNFGTGSAVDMSYAPGNDPFIITVGATDQHGTADPSDDTVAPWSAYGFTADGFSKPDLVSPGRFMIMPVPMRSTIPNTVPERVVSPGYMWMSGTSFAAPVVAGAAAELIARHPDWGPNEVKGALMLSTTYLGDADWQAAGVGELSAGTAAEFDFTPPNPNENLDAYLTTDPVTGAPTFDQAAWASAVSTEAAWSSAAWSSAAWASAAWASAAWASAAWASAAWSSGTFTVKADSAMSNLATYSESTFDE